MQWKFTWRKDFLLMIKWGNMAGQIACAISVSACIPLKLPWPWIPPPVSIDLCGSGSLSLSMKPACPGLIPFTLSGSVSVTLSVSADFGVCSITFASLALGISAGTSGRTYEAHCWWHNQEGRRRRRWWTRRRRDTRHCHYAWTCDVYITAYVELTIAIAKARISVTYWVLWRNLNIDLTLHAYEFWKLGWGGWRQMYSTVLFRYNFS